MLVDRPLVCPILVGRARQLEAIRSALVRAQAERGQTILIAAEAGIGKSRLISEAKKLAEERGFLTLEGQCLEQDRSLPYAPLIDLLHTFLASGSPEVSARFAVRSSNS